MTAVVSKNNNIMFCLYFCIDEKDWRLTLMINDSTSNQSND